MPKASFPNAGSRPDPNHPVLELLRRRRESAGRPGARADSDRLALVIEGGGMRGIVSSAMTAALERGGFTDCFDLIVGCSAGALNGASLLAHVAEPSMQEYWGAFADRRFVNLFRVFAGRPAVNLSYVLDYVSDSLDEARHERTLRSSIELHCIATNVESGTSDDLQKFESVDELRTALLASSRLPSISGPPVTFRGGRYLDGGITEPVPFRTALNLGSTHILVLLTRPMGALYPKPHGLQEWIVDRELRSLNPRLAEIYRTRGPRYDAVIRDVRERQSSTSRPFVLALHPPARLPVVRRLERDSTLLRMVAETCLEDAAEILGESEGKE